MRVLIYGINFSPELTGIGKYSGEMAQWLAESGHEVRVVTAPPYYPDWSVAKGFTNKSYSRDLEGTIEVIRCPLYVPSNPTAITRILHLLSFSISSSFPVLGSIFWKPDVVIQVVPTLFCSLQTLIMARLSGAQSVVHIQDYEVDAMFDLSIAKGGWVKRVAYSIERTILNRFNWVSTISEGMIKRAKTKGIASKKLLFFPNWSELGRFRNVDKNVDFLSELGVDSNKRIVLYSGNMGEKQGLETVVEAANKMRDNSDVHFLIVGEGAAKIRLQALATGYELPNMTFAPLQPYEKLPELLASADCHLVIQKHGAADAVLPSKLTNILAVGGNAVITSVEETTLGEMCLSHPGIATLVEPESVPALIDGIEQTLLMPMPNNVAKSYALENLDKDTILNRFFSLLDHRFVGEFDKG